MHRSTRQTFREIRILLAINPEYSKCLQCHRYIHTQKNIMMQKNHFGMKMNYSKLNCFTCVFNYSFLYEFPADDQIPVIEEIYANLYSVKFNTSYPITGGIQRIYLTKKDL